MPSLQTLISFRTAIKSVWKTQVFVVGPKEAKSKLQNFWAATSLVSALLITVSYITNIIYKEYKFNLLSIR